MPTLPQPTPGRPPRDLQAVHSNATDPRIDGDTAPLVLSVREAATLLGISKDLAYEIVRTGEIPALKFGRRVVVPKRRLLALIDGVQEHRERGTIPVGATVDLHQNDADHR
jgi:excisionase family DNA binding protein